MFFGLRPFLCQAVGRGLLFGPRLKTIRSNKRHPTENDPTLLVLTSGKMMHMEPDQVVFGETMLPPQQSCVAGVHVSFCHVPCKFLSPKIGRSGRNLESPCFTRLKPSQRTDVRQRFDSLKQISG